MQSSQLQLLIDFVGVFSVSVDVFGFFLFGINKLENSDCFSFIYNSASVTVIVCYNNYEYFDILTFVINTIT